MLLRLGFVGRRRLCALIGALAMLAGGAVPLDRAVAVEVDWLDHSFGGGLQTFDLSAGRDPAADIAVQSDGKVARRRHGRLDFDLVDAQDRRPALPARRSARHAGSVPDGKVVVERADVKVVIGLGSPGRRPDSRGRNR